MRRQVRGGAALDKTGEGLGALKHLGAVSGERSTRRKDYHKEPPTAIVDCIVSMVRSNAQMNE